jgi:predicted amino acid-binding ACT domain protein
MTIERAAVSVGVDLTVRLPDRPGSMADLCERLASNGIEIEGICGSCLASTT